MTFRRCADAFITAHQASWKNAKHRQQWTNTLETYANPILGDMAIDKVETDAVLRVLEPIWTSKTETASRVRMRLESLLDWATAKELRSGDNPASRERLKRLLPAQGKVAKVRHHAAQQAPISTGGGSSSGGPPSCPVREATGSLMAGRSHQGSGRRARRAAAGASRRSAR